MSHNAQSINGIAPDAGGNVTLALGDLTDVTLGTLTNGDVLVKTNSGWGASSVAGAAASFIFTGAGASVAYPVTSFNTGDVIYFHAGGLINNISGASINYLSGAEGEWIESITLPIGKWTVQAQTAFEFSANGYLAHILTANGAYISNIASVGSDISVYGYAPTQMQAIINATAATTISVKIHAALNVATTQPSFYPSQCSTILVRKVL